MLFSPEEIKIMAFTLSQFRGSVAQIKFVYDVIVKVGKLEKEDVQLSPEEASLLLNLMSKVNNYTLDVAQYIDVLVAKLNNLLPKVDSNVQTKE